jgi:hypothetical protein
MSEKNSMDLLREYSARDLLITSLSRIMNYHDTDGLKKLMSSNTFSALPRNEIEFKAFNFAYFRTDNNFNNDMLKYLIFDYGIKEEVSIDLIKKINPIVKHMFEVRNLKSELSSDLDSKKQANKKMKI